MKKYQEPKKPSFNPEEEIKDKHIRKLSDLTLRLHAFEKDYTRQEYEDFIRILGNFLAKELAHGNSVTLPGLCTFDVSMTNPRWINFKGEKKFYESRPLLKIRRSVGLSALLREIWEGTLPLEAVANPIDPRALRRNVTIKVKELSDV